MGEERVAVGVAGGAWPGAACVAARWVYARELAQDARRRCTHL